MRIRLGIQDILPGMLGRKLAFGLVILTILGCSGLSSLVAKNRTNEIIHLSIAGNTSEAREAKWSGSIEPGHSVETIKWFSHTPRPLKISVTSPKRNDHYTASNEQFPKGMQVGSSAKSTYFMDVNPSGVEFRDPTTFQRMMDQPHVFFAQLIGCVTFIGVVLLPWFVIKVLRTLRAQKS